MLSFVNFFFQAEDGIRDLVRSRGLGDVYKRQDRDEIQGYYYSKPLPIEVLEEFLKKENA